MAVVEVLVAVGREGAPELTGVAGVGDGGGGGVVVDVAAGDCGVVAVVATSVADDGEMCVR